MRNLKNIMIILLTGLFAVGFFSSCAEANTSYSDAEKAVLVNKAITEGGTTPRAISGTERTIARPVTGGGLTVDNTIDKSAFTGSDFYTSDVNTWPNPSTFVFYFGLTYNNLTITVQDDSGSTVTVVLDGSVNYGYYIAGDGSFTAIIFGTLTGSVDGDGFNFTMDLKTSVSSDGSTFTMTGTVGGVTINETY